MIWMLLLALQAAPAPPSAVPVPTGATPGACLKEVSTYVDGRRAAALAKASADLKAGADQATVTQQRATAFRQIDADRLSLAKTCAAKFDLKTAPDGTLADLAALYGDAGQPEMAQAAIDRAMASKTLPSADRASVLSLAIQRGLAETKSDARNARLEKLSGELDALPASVAFAQQWGAHQSLEGYYRYDDIDAGIIKHANWILEAASKFTPEDRRKYGSTAVGAYVNMAEAWAGQGMNDQAIALLHRAVKDFPDVPNVEGRVKDERERLELVGTPAAPLTAPRWLNMPAGQTTLDLKGHVTLLEFSAHWCVPCKESYPGVNRLRTTYGKQGFQAVLVTQMWGYFQTERNLDAETEYQRDKTYFAEHGLDIPIAIGDRPTIVRNDAGTMSGRDANDLHYKVGGIPQIMLVDKQGKIRLMMVGYDDANEAKLAKMIEAMLKEK